MGKTGRAFKAITQEIVTINEIPSFDSQRLSAMITIFPRDKRKFDLDNRLKAIFDSLQDAGVYDNDEQFDKIQVARGKTKPKGGCTVVIYTEE